MSDGLSLRPYSGAFGSEMPVGVDLHLHTAVAKNSLGHHRDHVDAFDFGRNNERCRLVVGIRRAGTDRSDKRLTVIHQSTVPLASTLHKRNNLFAAAYSTIQHDVRIEPHEFAFMIAVPIARSGTSRLDVTQYRAGIAADRIVSHERLRWTAKMPLL